MILDDILKVLNDNNNKNNIAYISNGISYTYFDVLKYVSNIYNYLKEQLMNNVSCNSNNLSNDNNDIKSIVIYGHKEIYMKASILASSFLGYTYVVIDTSMPKDRIINIIDEVKPKAIIGLDKDYFENVENFNSKDLDSIKFINKDFLEKIMNKEEFSKIDKIYMKPSDIYYMIFTSGSTGIPKGVKVTYTNIDSCVKWLEKTIELSSNDVIINQAIFSFDLSVADFYLSLVKNATHFILDVNLINLNNVYNDLKISDGKVMVITPSFAELLLLDESFNEEMLPKLRTIVFCGEELSNKVLENIYSRFSNVDVINMYGPTECTYAVTSIKLDRNIKYDKIPLGKAKDDCYIKIVNEKLEEVENNILGEILILGDTCVSNGYLDESKNDKFIIYNGLKGYLTGDIGYIGKDNLLYFVGRKDSQVKYQGYRIDLLDIEKNLLKISYIDKCVVVPKKDKSNKVIKIYAFVKLNKSIVYIDTDYKGKIKEELRRYIPNYMIPNIKIVGEFPLNQNGKCDKKKLMEDYL